MTARASSAAERWRRTGADLPFGDPLPLHGTETEGYLWRFTDAANGRVLLAACTVNQHPEGAWAGIVLAAEPGGFQRTMVVERDVAGSPGFGFRAGTRFRYREGQLDVNLGEEAELSTAVLPTSSWPGRGLHAGGLFSVLPGLPHYWHPHVFDARLDGYARVGTESWKLGEFTAYAEKAWGRGFPTRWWWGQAHGFDRPDVCVAFAGSALRLGNVSANPSVLVARVGPRVIRLAPPFAGVRTRIGQGTWQVTGRDLRSRVVVTADTGGSVPRTLPLPMPALRRTRPATHYLTGRLRLDVERDGRPVFAGETPLASLEAGGFDT
ncbi:tocopherol cyclase family protein [Nocardia sp. BMG51109]|uniref:tocopherol cyclase family protein n=1 Tax=Nocardia sp. BMG51109 TaxID=1056816 RepID=UPI000463DA80|nr:tocopherol cyclase family protein [Nocardia sp. BMG51109]